MLWLSVLSAEFTCCTQLSLIKILSRIHSTELLLNRKKEKQVFLLNFQEYHSVRREKCMKIEM